MNLGIGNWRQILHGKDRLGRVAGGDPAADLRKALIDLEADLADTEKQLAAAEADVTACHSRAVALVREGRDVEACTALVDKSSAKELRDRLDADAAVLRAMIAECRAVLETAQPPA